MDPVEMLSRDEIKAEIRDVMERWGFDELEAAEFVLGGYGFGDVRFSRPLTAEERRRMGFDLGPHNDPRLIEDDQRTRKSA